MKIPWPKDFLPTRASLLSRIKDWDDEKSWREFFSMYWRLIFVTAVKAGLTEHEAEDVVQETVLAIARKVKEFRYEPARGSFKGYLLKTTQWKIKDQYRKRAREGLQGDRPDTVRPESDPETTSGPVCFDEGWEEDWQENLLQVAMENVSRRISPRQFQAFQLYVLKEWPVSKVAEALGLSMASVYVTKHRVREMLKSEITRLNETPF